MLSVSKELLKESLGSEERILELMFNLAAGNSEESPFEDAVAEGLRNWLTEHAGVPESRRGKPEGQEMYLGTVSYLLKLLGDPDWDYPMSPSEGGSVGGGDYPPKDPGRLRREDEVEPRWLRWGSRHRSGEL